MPAVFDRRVTESGSAWDAFRWFRDTPAADRSVDEAWRRSKGITDARRRAPRHWWGWYKDHEWVERAVEHDRSIDAEARRQAAYQVVEQRRRMARELEAAQRVLAQPIVELLRRFQTRTLDLTTIDAGDLTRMVLAASAVLPRLQEQHLRLLGLDVGDEPARGFEGELRELPTDVERLAEVYAALEEAGQAPAPRVVESSAVVRELPRRAAS